jgi:hypothetical protein
MVLEHTPGLAIGPGGCRIWDQNMEEEANLLAAILLVPREAALMCARIGLPHAVGAARFGVSPTLMRWRTDHSGASKQARAEAQRRGRSISRLSAQHLAQLLAACDLAWLSGVTEREWRRIVAASGRCLSASSVSGLADCLSQPLAS